MPRNSSFKASGSQTPRDQAESLIFSLVEQYQDPLFRYVYFRTSNRALAFDIVQDVFAKTWQYLAEGKTITSHEAFLYRVAKNAVIDFFKKKKSVSLDSLEESGFEPSTTDEITTHEKMSDLTLLQKLVEGLDEESKQIILMRFIEERPIEEIARAFGKTTNAMTVKIHRVITQLRSRYEQYDT